MSKDTIKLFKSSNAVVVVLVLALLAQMPHAQFVLYNSSREQNNWTWWQAVIGAIALEIAVLVFTVRGNVRVSWGFAAFSISINLIYYLTDSAKWYEPKFILLSAGLPIAIALYSHEVVERTEHANEQKPDTKPEPQPAKRVTRTVRSTQTVEASEQVEEQPVQFAVQLEDNSVQLDLASLSIEQKKVYALDLMRAGKVNMSKLADELKVQRPRLYEWKKELA